MKLKNYQNEACNRLIEDSKMLLQIHGTQLKQVFKAITGAGKTYTMAAYTKRMLEEYSNIVYLWLAPNKLHEQSFSSFDNFFANNAAIKPVSLSQVNNKCLNPGEVLFMNWQSVIKEDNTAVKETEKERDVFTVLKNSKDKGYIIIAILDEAHAYASKGERTLSFLKKVNAKIEIDVSATPYFSSDYTTVVPSQRVKNAGMIKQQVLLNTSDDIIQEERTMDQLLLDRALAKREEVALTYKEKGININPLLMIQLPSDKTAISSDEKKKITEIEAYLKDKGFTYQNNKVARMLSGDNDLHRQNLKNITDNNDITDVLIFKQAAALGWDCKRAHVLIIFREIKDKTFGAQTIGRILRMPEQKAYTNALLDTAFVYTNLSAETVEIVKEDYDYIYIYSAKRSDRYKNTMFLSDFINRRISRNRLSSKFKECLQQAIEEDQDNFNKAIEKNVDEIELYIPSDVILEIDPGNQTKLIGKERLIKTVDELKVSFDIFCKKNVGDYAPIDSLPVLRRALLTRLSEYLGHENETIAIKLILESKNQVFFSHLIEIAREKHEGLLQEKAKSTTADPVRSDWHIPEVRFYNNNYKIRDVEKHILEPFYEGKNASTVEKGFVTFLEHHQENIDWWYKNGDNGKQHFSVSYVGTEGDWKGFYVDFIIKMKTGRTYFFDTKSLGSDSEMEQKQLFLFKYISELKNKGKDVEGGIIIRPNDQDNMTWRWANKNKINMHDAHGWPILEL